MSYDYKRFIPSDLPLLMEYDAHDEDEDVLYDTWRMLLELLGKNVLSLLDTKETPELTVDGYNLCWRGTYATKTIDFASIEQHPLDMAKHLLWNTLTHIGHNSIKLYADLDRKVPKIILVVFTHDCNQVFILNGELC